MRRTVASQYEVLGGDATKLLGHFDRSVTEGHYLDPRVVVRPQAIDRLGKPDELLPKGEPQVQVEEVDAAAWL